MALNRQFEALTGIRGLAALWVVCEHFFPSAEMKLLSAQGFQGLLPLVLFEKGYLAVDIFFILSGFIIAFVYRQEFAQFQWSKVTTFLLLRLARIYPAHLVMLLAFFAYALIFNTFSEDPQRYRMDGFVYSLFLLHTLMTPKGQILWNAPAWSISVEWFAYLLFPFSGFLLFSKNNSLRFNLLMVCILYFGFVLYYVLGQFGTLDWYSNIEPYIKIIFEFPLGCCLYNIYNHTQNSDKLWSVLGIGSIVAILLGICSFGLPDIVYVPLFMVLLLALANATPVLRLLFANRLLVYLGTISYSIYLAHNLIFSLFFRLLLPRIEHLSSPQIWVCIAMLFLGVIGAGHLLYTKIELPSRDFIRKNAYVPLTPQPETA